MGNRCLKQAITLVALKGSQIVRNYMLPSLQPAPRLVKEVFMACYEDLNMETRLCQKDVNSFNISAGNITDIIWFVCSILTLGYHISY